MPATSALLVIDIQNDFCDGGALAVPGGGSIVSGVNALMAQSEIVVLSQDWHPVGHKSFASSHAGKVPYDVIDMPYGAQVLWPDHCVQGSPGAEFHSELASDHAQLIVRKGVRAHIDSYSAFFENDRSTPTGLHGALQNLGVSHVTVVGLALDFCVQYTALDARKLDYQVTVMPDLCRAIDLDGSKSGAMAAMSAAGVSFE